MDHLQRMPGAIDHETRSEKPHLGVFRDFLARLDELQRAAATSRTRPAPRRKPMRRAKA